MQVCTVAAEHPQEIDRTSLVANMEACWNFGLASKSTRRLASVLVLMLIAYRRVVQGECMTAVVEERGVVRAGYNETIQRARQQQLFLAQTLQLAYRMPTVLVVAYRRCTHTPSAVR